MLSNTEGHAYYVYEYQSIIGWYQFFIYVTNVGHVFCACYLLLLLCVQSLNPWALGKETENIKS